MLGAKRKKQIWPWIAAAVAIVAVVSFTVWFGGQV